MDQLNQKQKVTIMIAIMSAMFFATVNMTIVGTSLPRIVESIGGIEYFDWVFTTYMLTSTIAAMLVGKLSDIYGRKILILIGICIFTVGSFLCGTSSAIVELILYRGIQGLGAGMIMSAAIATVGDLFVPRERGRWQGMLGAVFGLSSLIGPTLGGYIVDHFDWYWVFWVFLPLGILAFIMILSLYPTFTRTGAKEKVDYVGSLLLSMVIVSLLLGFTWAGKQYDWVSFPIIGLFSMSLFSLIAFIIVEQKVESPILPLYLFKNSVFTVSNTVGFFLGMGLFGTIIYVPFYIQGVLGKSATTSGFIQMTMTISMVIVSIIIGILISKTGKYKAFAIIGFLIMAIGLYFTSAFELQTPLWQVIVVLTVIGIGIGMNMPVFNITVQNAVSHKYLGVATSAMQTFRQIGGTIGVAILGNIMANQMSSQLSSNMSNVPTTNEELPAAFTVLNSPQALMNPEQLADVRATLPSSFVSQFDQLVLVLKASLNDALAYVFIAGTLFVIIAGVITFFLKEIPLRTSNREEQEPVNNNTPLKKQLTPMEES
ncbi:MDR family MFS transporter [Longirhabdus pacifica]|uniref:MDR family MFS transporter n=1 Tax=Longirhabdus pacifica TaxID=2305227 RepID=UPI0010091931|nr:MDR family MFS transporter [Longirhabdus pacifica]